MSRREDAHLLSGAYALDAVTPEEASDMERSMLASEDLRSEVAELTDTAVLLGLSVAPAEPSPDLRARLLAAIETTPQLPAEPVPDHPLESAVSAAPLPEPEPGPGPAAPSAPAPGHGRRSREAQRRWFRQPGALLAAAAAAVALIFGAGVVVDSATRPAPSAAVSFAELTSAADVHHRAAPVRGGGDVAVYWSQKLGASAVVVTGTSVPAGKALQLWKIEGSAITSAGLYHPASGEHYQVLKGSMHAGQALGITVEPAGGSPRPTSKPIAAIPIT